MLRVNGRQIIQLSVIYASKEKLVTRNQIKLFATAILVLPFLALVVFRTDPVQATSPILDDPAAAYKAKCAACHSPKAEKFFDVAKPAEQHIEIVLKGKKGEKPPYMPGFEAKGMTGDDAKALVEYMKALRAPTN